MQLLGWTMRVFVALGLLLGCWLSGSEPPGRLLFRTYGADQGLSTPSLSCLAQDSEGLLWVGTENGLFRYEGAAFHKVLLEGATSTWILDLRPARGGGLWVNVNHSIYHLRHGRLRRLEEPGKPGQALVGAFDVDGKGFLWAVGFGTLWKEQETGGVIQVASLPPGSAVRSIAFGPVTGALYIMREKDLLAFRDSHFETVELPELGKEALRAAAEDGDGALWVLSTTRLFGRMPGNARIQDFTEILPSPFFSEGSLHRDPSGRVWVPTNGGVLALRGSNREWIDARVGLPSRWVRQAFLDREGNLWLIGRTLMRLLGRGGMRAFTQGDGLAGDVVWSLLRDRRARLWAGTNDGLCWLGADGWHRVPGSEGSSPGTLVEDPWGGIWAGCTNASLFRVAPDGGKAQPVKLQSLPGLAGNRTPAGGGQVTALLMDREGQLWVALNQVGLLRVDPATHQIQEKVDPAGIDSADANLNKLVQDRRGRIWLATSHGLFCLAEGRWRHFRNELKHPSVLGIALLSDDDEICVYYEEPFGITRLRFESDHLIVLGQIDTAIGLASNLALSASLGVGGELWVGTDQGLDRVGVDGIRHFGRGVGLVGEDCCQNALWVDAGGDVFVGTTEGIGHVVGAQVPAPLPPPETRILEFQRGARIEHPPFGGRVDLPYRERTVQFHFTSLSLQDEGRQRFEVRLMGFEPEWRSVENRVVRYPALPPGDYRFEVRCGFPNEGWGPPAILNFRVIRPWWLNRWLLLFTGAVIVGILWTWVNARMGKLARAKAKLEVLVAKRTEDLQKANHALTEANRALENLSLTDPLTGLHNRRYLALVIEEEVTKTLRVYRDAKPTAPLPNLDLVFFMVDIDHFKSINDHHGHAAGDAVIRRVAEVLQRAARESDSVIRMGGEEFLVIARSSSRAEAPLIAERIRLLMAEQVLSHEGTTVQWTCSTGFAALPFQPLDPNWLSWEQVLEIADACLYAAKASGRNAWVGVHSRPGLKAAAHGTFLPSELERLQAEGVIEVLTSRDTLFAKAPESAPE